MSRETNAARIGAFVIGAILLVVATVLIWGSRKIFERKYEYVCYFPGSVLGLREGAPVKYRGVDVGVVKKIKVRFRQAPDDKRIPVFVDIWSKRLESLGAGKPTPDEIRELVETRGFRARVASLSLVTGLTYVSMEELPDTPLVYVELPGPEAIPEIPTAPAELEEVTKSVSELLSNLATTDFNGMANSVTNTMNGVNQLVTSDDLQGAIARLPPLLAGIGRLAKTLNTDADKASGVMDDARGALAAVHETAQNAQGVVSPEAPLSANLTVALSDVDKAAIAVRELADFLRRNPHSIVAGTKPRQNP